MDAWDLPVMPPPRRGGSRLYCPLVDVAATERTKKLHMCGYSPRARTWRGAKALRRHMFYDHFIPFLEGTRNLVWDTPLADVNAGVH